MFTAGLLSMHIIPLPPKELETFPIHTRSCFITPHPQDGRNYDSDRTVRRTLLLMSNAPAEPQETT